MMNCNGKICNLKCREIKVHIYVHIFLHPGIILVRLTRVSLYTHTIKMHVFVVVISSPKYVFTYDTFPIMVPEEVVMHMEKYTMTPVSFAVSAIPYTFDSIRFNFVEITHQLLYIVRKWTLTNVYTH